MPSMTVLAKSIVFTLTVAATVAVYIPQVLIRYRPHPELPIPAAIARILGVASLSTGLLMYVHTVFEFGKGEGTPSPTDEPETLVTDGVYAHSRNPMYIAVLLVILGQALLQRSVVAVWWAVGMWIGFHNRVIGYEEPHLREKHGEAFEDYCESVPRWLSFDRTDD